MKIYYFNDEKEPVMIRLIGALPDCTNTYVELQPMQGRTFEIVDAPEGSIPFVKRWSTRIVLLSYISEPKSDHNETSCKL